MNAVHPALLGFFAFLFAVPAFLMGVGVGSRRVGLIVLPWFPVYVAYRFIRDTVGLRGWPPGPLLALWTIVAAVAVAFWLGWLSGAGRWITQLPWTGRRAKGWRAPRVSSLVMAAAGLLLVFGGDLGWAIRWADSGRAERVQAPSPATPFASPEAVNGIEDAAGLLTEEARGHVAHYVRILGERGFTYRIASFDRLPDQPPFPAGRGIVLEAAREGHATRITVGPDLRGALTAEQCAALAAETRRELVAGNPVGAFWGTSGDVWGILVEGRRPPGPLTPGQWTEQRGRETRGVVPATAFVALFAAILGGLFGAAAAARNLLWAVISGGFLATTVAFFSLQYLEWDLWWPLIATGCTAAAAALAGRAIGRRHPGFLRPGEPLSEWEWGVRFGGVRGGGSGGGGFGGFGGGRSGGGGSSGRW